MKRVKRIIIICLILTSAILCACAGNAAAPGVRPEFKKAVDSYEEFFDEYCSFMDNYAKSDNPLGLMTEYLNYLSQYATMMQKFSAIADSEMNEAEALYYQKANERILKKLNDYIAGQ